MKLLVFAHTPPPHHGQSYMVKLMLEGFGGDARACEIEDSESTIACYHVNARYSEALEDIGAFRFGKALLVLRYCLEAIWCRFRYGIDAFYYVPAPGKRAALYRDWIVMLLCRPFFRHFIHHWHAVGLGDWLQREATRSERWLTHRLLGRPALGIALAIPSMRDALWFRSRDVELVHNGIPDPCPDFVENVLPQRRARLAARQGCESAIYRVLFLAHCMREKGLFDTLEAIALANARLASARVRLTVAGLFPREAEEVEFRERIAKPDLASVVEYRGFVSGEEKAALLRDCDCLCFPTFYPAEGQPVNLIEALAVGMNVVTTRWRAIPEMLPPDYPGFAAPSAPDEIAAAIIAAMTRDDALALRERFLALFAAERHVEALREALLQVAA